MDKNAYNPSQILRNFHTFLEEGYEEEVRNAPISEVRQELIADGIDIDKFQNEIIVLLVSMKAKQSLLESRQKRLTALIALKKKMAELSEYIAEKPEFYMNQLKDVFNLSEQEVMAYCRKFDGATDKDRLSLIVDSILLDKLENEETTK